MRLGEELDDSSSLASLSSRTSGAFRISEVFESEV